MPGAQWARRVMLVLTFFLVGTMVLGLVLTGLR